MKTPPHYVVGQQGPPLLSFLHFDSSFTPLKERATFEGVTELTIGGKAVSIIAELIIGL